MALDFGNKVENGGIPPNGVLSASEFNQLVAQVNQNDDDIQELSTPKSAYGSYLDTTTDNPPLTEEEWVASLHGADGVDLGQVAIADNTTTDDATKVLSARQGKKLGDKAAMLEARSDLLMGEKTYNDSSLSKGRAWKNSEDPVPQVDNTWPNARGGSMQLEVSKGDSVTVNTQAKKYASGGAYHAVPWCVTDTSRNVIEVCEATDDAITKTLDISQDGYVFINCGSDYYNSFAVTHTYSKAAADIAELQDEVEELNDKVDDFLSKKTYDEESLVPSESTGGYYDLGSLSVGSVAPDTYTVNSGSPAWKCLRLPVVGGQTIIISTVGGRNARAYAITDSSRKVLQLAPAPVSPATTYDTTSNPVSISVEQNGYLYVNCKVSLQSNFYVEVSIDMQDALEAIGGEIEDIEEQIADIEEQIADIEVGNNPYSPHYKNNPLPLWKDTLKILTIGNSYSDDMMSYVGSLAAAAGISPNKLGMYRTYQGSGSLQNWCENYENGVILPATDPDRSCVKAYGNISMITTGTLAQILAQDWDIVILHQASKFAADYTSFNPYLTKLVGYIRENCTNQQVCIAWQSVWSYKSGYTSSGITYEDSEARWAEICDATKQMMHNDGIDIIIPTGTAIQNARAFQELNPSFNAENTGEVTRDGTHIEFGVGRYIIACTFFQTILAPIFGVSVLGNTAVHAITSGEQSSNQNAYGAVAVDDNNRVLCQLLAFAATTNKWSITNVTNHAIPDNTSLPMYSSLSQEQINAGADTAGKLISSKLLHDNAYIAEETYTSGSLKANKMYDFGEVTTALVLPDLDVTNDLVSNAMNFWALHFKVGELTPAGTTELSITFPQNPSGIIVDDEPTIKEGDYVEIMITKHTVGSDTNYYASIKVWQAQ